jgi:hypothetical protein
MTDKPVCAKCGQVHKGCKAHRRRIRPLVPCTMMPSAGSEVCRHHGANGGGKGKEHTIALRKQRVAEQKARQTLASYGEPIPVDATDALLELIAWSNGHVEWLREKVRETDPESLVWGESENSVKVGGDDHGTKTTETAGPSVWLKLYGEERDRLAKYVKDAASIGIEEKRTQLAERFGQHLLHLLELFALNLRDHVERVWELPGFDEEWPEIVRQQIPRALRAISAASKEEVERNVAATVAGEDSASPL